MMILPLFFNINFPLFMGVLAAVAHVLTGPDHLAAVTPLVFDTQKKHWRIGFLWGLGHIIGMLLIGFIFYLFKDVFAIDSFSNYSEKFVGFILIGIGFWAFYRINNKQSQHKHPHFHDKTKRGSLIHIHKHQHRSQAHEHTHNKSINQNNLTAIFIGIIHGFAGIAHFVLLLPVLGFTSRQESLQYIIGFILGILLAMILYTLVLGKVQKTQQTNIKKPLVYNIQFWSGVLAILVGIYWIFIQA